MLAGLQVCRHARPLLPTSSVPTTLHVFSTWQHGMAGGLPWSVLQISFPFSFLMTTPTRVSGWCVAVLRQVVNGF